MIPANTSLFSPKQAISDRKTERLRVTILPALHLANAFVWNLCAIRCSWQLPVKWRVTGVKARCLYYSCLRSQEARLWRERRGSWWDLTVYKSVCLKVNRSEEVPRPRDPQVWLDNSIYSLCPWQRHHWQMERENKGADCTCDDLKARFSGIITWSLWFFACLWCLKDF